MMKIVLVSCLLFVAVSAAPAPDGEDTGKYTGKYDNVDIDEILSNDRLYSKYFECLTGVIKCTPDGKELKDKIPEALETKCAKCTDKQKKGIEKVFKYISEHKKEDFEKLKEIYDPEGKHIEALKDLAKEHGITV